MESSIFFIIIKCFKILFLTQIYDLKFIKFILNLIIFYMCLYVFLKFYILLVHFKLNFVLFFSI